MHGFCFLTEAFWELLLLNSFCFFIYFLLIPTVLCLVNMLSRSWTCKENFWKSYRIIQLNTFLFIYIIISVLHYIMHSLHIDYQGIKKFTVSWPKSQTDKKIFWYLFSNCLHTTYGRNKFSMSSLFYWHIDLRKSSWGSCVLPPWLTLLIVLISFHFEVQAFHLVIPLSISLYFQLPCLFFSQ